MHVPLYAGRSLPQFLHLMRACCVSIVPCGLMGLVSPIESGGTRGAQYPVCQRRVVNMFGDAMFGGGGGGLLLGVRDLCLLVGSVVVSCLPRMGGGRPSSMGNA